MTGKKFKELKASYKFYNSLSPKKKGEIKVVATCLRLRKKNKPTYRKIAAAISQSLKGEILPQVLVTLMEDDDKIRIDPKLEKRARRYHAKQMKKNNKVTNK